MTKFILKTFIILTFLQPYLEGSSSRRVRGQIDKNDILYLLKKMKNYNYHYSAYGFQKDPTPDYGEKYEIILDYYGRKNLYLNSVITNLEGSFYGKQGEENWEKFIDDMLEIRDNHYLYWYSYGEPKDQTKNEENLSYWDDQAENILRWLKKHFATKEDYINNKVTELENQREKIDKTKLYETISKEEALLITIEEEEEEEEEILHIDGRDFVVANTPGDGHCFFHAIALYVQDLDVENLREIAAQEIRKNPEYYKKFFANAGKITFDKWVNLLAKTNEWADNLAITALQRALGRPIIIRRPNGDITRIADESLEDNYDDPIYVFYNGHNHYDGLVVKEENAGGAAAKAGGAEESKLMEDKEGASSKSIKRKHKLLSEEKEEESAAAEAEEKKPSKKRQKKPGSSSSLITEKDLEQLRKDLITQEALAKDLATKIVQHYREEEEEEYSSSANPDESVASSSSPVTQEEFQKLKKELLEQKTRVFRLEQIQKMMLKKKS
jgi:hypothetical protein